MKQAGTELIAVVAIFVSVGRMGIERSGTPDELWQPAHSGVSECRPADTHAIALYDKAPSLTPSTKSGPAKEPYDYRYYGDTDRRNVGWPLRWLSGDPQP